MGWGPPKWSLKKKSKFNQVTQWKGVEKPCKIQKLQNSFIVICGCKSEQ